MKKKILNVGLGLMIAGLLSASLIYANADKAQGEGQNCTDACSMSGGACQGD